MQNIIVTKYGVEPPKTGPLNLNGIVYKRWLCLDTDEEKFWNGKKWAIVPKVGKDTVCVVEPSIVGGVEQT